MKCNEVDSCPHSRKVSGFISGFALSHVCPAHYLRYSALHTLKLSLGRRQTFPPGRSQRIAVLCFMQTSPQGRSLHSPCCVDRLRHPQGLAAGHCQAKLPESDRGADFYLNLIPLSEEHSLPLVSYLNLIPLDYNCVLWISLAKHMIQGLLVLDWLTEL